MTRPRKGFRRMNHMKRINESTYGCYQQVVIDSKRTLREDVEESFDFLRWSEESIIAKRNIRDGID